MTFLFGKLEQFHHMSGSLDQTIRTLETTPFNATSERHTAPDQTPQPSEIHPREFGAGRQLKPRNPSEITSRPNATTSFLIPSSPLRRTTPARTNPPARPPNRETQPRESELRPSSGFDYSWREREGLQRARERGGWRWVVAKPGARRAGWVRQGTHRAELAARRREEASRPRPAALLLSPAGRWRGRGRGRGRGRKTGRREPCANAQCGAGGIKRCATRPAPPPARIQAESPEKGRGERRLPRAWQAACANMGQEFS